MSRFLRLAVTETLAGRTDRLKEYVIGVEVFDRPVSFDPAADPIVRVEARRLRTKLEKYYRSEGRHDDVIIELPKGGYVPVFRMRQQADTPEPAAGSPHTIAVLPLANLSETADPYFTDGLTWELIHRLTRIEGLAVVALHSASQVAAEPFDSKAIAARLNVRSILRCAVRRSAERLRVMAQLVDATSGLYLWSETFDREAADVFAIQEDIANAIVATLRLRLTGPAKTAEPTASKYRLEAYDTYLRARSEWNKRTSIALRNSVEMYRHAIAIDDRFALAHAGLADAYALLADYGLEQPSEVMPAAKAAAQRALDIDPNLGEAHCSLAFILSLHEWRWDEAEEHYRRALTLNPGYATAHHWYSTDFLAILGRVEEAFHEVEIACRLDPLSSIIEEGRGYLMLISRQYDRAAEHYRKIIRNDPSFYKAHTSLGRALIQLGLYDEAIAQLEHGRALAGDVPNIFAAITQAYALSGCEPEARATFDKMVAIAARQYVPPTAFAIAYMGLGEEEKALDYLAAAAERREIPVSGIAAHPVYDPLRSHPRFIELIRRMRLAR